MSCEVKTLQEAIKNLVCPLDLFAILCVMVMSFEGLQTRKVHLLKIVGHCENHEQLFSLILSCTCNPLSTCVKVWNVYLP